MINGIKFISLDCLIMMKKKRNEAKDIQDVRLIMGLSRTNSNEFIPSLKLVYNDVAVNIAITKARVFYRIITAIKLILPTKFHPFFKRALKALRNK